MRERRTTTWTRLASSLVLVIAAWSWVAVVWATPARGCGLLIATGMTLGFLGDLFMAGALAQAPNVPAGMAAFGAGHAAYIIAGLTIARYLGLTARASLWGAWLAWLALGAVGWWCMVMRPRVGQPTPLHWVALPYALLLASTAGVASGLAVQQIAFLPLAAGAALFLFSDLLIAAGMFGQQRPGWMDELIWLTYGPGQMLIVYGSGAALMLA